MTEQQESQVKPQPTAVVNNSKSRSGTVLGGVAILLALGLTGGLYLHGHRMPLPSRPNWPSSSSNWRAP